MRIVKAFWGGHIDLDHVVHVGPVISEAWGDPYFDVMVLLCDKPLTIYAPVEKPDDVIAGSDRADYLERKRLEFVAQWGCE